MLRVENLTTAYGSIEALRGVSLDANEGETTCILGPNGAGKTTLMFTIAGILQPRSGTVRFCDKDIAGLSAHRIVACGLVLVPENRLVFPQMTVRENLDAGAYVRPQSDAKSVAEDMEQMFERFPDLRNREAQIAGTLSGGEQQMLALARALMARPKMLLMDEPSLGLAPRIVDEIYAIIRQLKDDGVSIVLVEQNAVRALEVADHFYLLDQGNVVFSGLPGEMENDEVIKKAYLGGLAV